MQLSRRKFLLKSGLATSMLSLGVSSFPFAARRITKNDAIHIGVIGTGSRGGYLTQLMRAIPGIEVIACCDILEANLKKGIEQAGGKAKAYVDYRKLLEDKNVEAVVIATPLYLHTQMALDALEAGKHIYCEKTMTYDIAQTQALVKKVKNSKAVFQVGFQQRTNPLHNKIYEIIKGGYLGEIKHVVGHYDRNGNWRRQVSNPKLERQINWRMYKEYSGGLMAELCSHQIDTVNWMLNAHPLQVMGRGSIDFWKDGRETYDHVHCLFDYPNGTQATFTSLTTSAYMGYSLKLLGTKGTIEIWNENGQRANIYFEATNQEIRKADERVDGTSGATQTTWVRGEAIPVIADNQPQNDAETTTIALTDFAHCIRNKLKPKSNIDSGSVSAIAVHMANQAMDKGSVEVWKPEYSAI